MRTSALVLVITGAMVVAGGPAEAFDVNLVVGADFAGEFDLAGITEDSEDGFSVGGELVFDLTRSLEAGAGLEYGFPRGSEDCCGDEVSIRHLYAVGRLHLIGGDVGVYAVGRFGYVDFGDVEDLGGGGSWSVGGGVSLGRSIKVEALLNQFSADLEGVDAEVDYETWSLRAVWTF